MSLNNLTRKEKFYLGIKLLCIIGTIILWFRGQLFLAVIFTTFVIFDFIVPLFRYYILGEEYE